MVLGPENLTNVEGENVQYKFFTHLLGSLNGFGKGIKIPARPFLPLKPSDLNADERRNIKKIINQAIIANTKVR
jgi:phage gpG-like protein